MLSLDDPKWSDLLGGYKTPYDPSHALRSLENGEDSWGELWEQLHHQGDVGEASYAAIPHIVRIARSLPSCDWNFYGLVSTIEIERHRKCNPPIPDWLAPAYADAIRDLLELALRDLPRVDNPDTVRSIFGAIALAKGDLKLGALISHSDESEIDEILDHYDAWHEAYN